MTTFLRIVSPVVLGVLSGFDRLMFRGHLRTLSFPGGMGLYCRANSVLYKDFKTHAQERTDRLIAASEGVAKQAGRPITYLRSSQARKEDLARALAEQDKIANGLIGMFTCVEPCSSFAVRSNRATKKLELRPEFRKCLHLYHYYQHPLFGLTYARVQTWFPYAVQIGINGREWLCRSLDAAGLKYRRADNCVTWVDDVAAAQKLLDDQVRLAWVPALEEIRRWVHPSHESLLGKFPVDYYWSLCQSEWATDVLFSDRQELQRRYEPWLRFAMMNHRSPDVLRFLGKKVPATGRVNCRFGQEVLSDVGHRVDGMRIKHRVGNNSIKMYDKAGTVLRVETTIQDPSEFQVLRPKASDPDGPPAWQPLRKGVADVSRRAEVSQASNERYLESVAATQHGEALAAVTAGLSKRVKEPGAGRRARGLNLLGDDAVLLEVVGRPEFALNGLRNRDVVAGLYAKPAATAAERKRRASRATRCLRLLRAHGLLRKVPRSHRYRVTDSGRTVIAAVLAARSAATAELVAKAA